MFSTSRDDETLTEVVGKTSAEACAAGLNYLAQVYHDGAQVTYPLYSEEEIAAVPARAHVELYYCPAQQPGAKFAIVLSGNSLYYSGELRGGVSTAWELHEQGLCRLLAALPHRMGGRGRRSAGRPGPGHPLRDGQCRHLRRLYGRLRPAGLLLRRTDRRRLRQ